MPVSMRVVPSGSARKRIGASAIRALPAANGATRASPRIGAPALGFIGPDLARVVTIAREVAAAVTTDLPLSVIHSDLFPDNVLMTGDRVSGMIDFYFACTDAMAYDLAVTHAAWSFDRTGARFDEGIGRALVEGYETVRPLEESERRALPLLAQRACLRFVCSRAEDWIDTPEAPLVIVENADQWKKI